MTIEEYEYIQFWLWRSILLQSFEKNDVYNNEVEISEQIYCETFMRKAEERELY